MQQAFKEVMAHWASGVTIVTSCQASKPMGMTASSFTSVSLRPPQVLICVSNQAYTHAAIIESGYFAINLLAVEQIDWGLRFAGLQPGVTDQERFQGIDYITAQTGAPILPGVLAWLDCRVRHAFASGDHTIFVGDVVDCGEQGDGLPLLYYNRGWRQLGAAVLETIAKNG